MKQDVQKRTNVEDRGFCSGEALETLIVGARFVVVPSECYENCPLTILESQVHGVPVLAADIGGIPELVRDGETGELFESGNAHELAEKITSLWNAEARLAVYKHGCKKQHVLTADVYCEKLERIYRGESQ